MPAYTLRKGIRETVRWYLDQQAWVQTVLKNAEPIGCGKPA